MGERPSVLASTRIPSAEGLQGGLEQGTGMAESIQIIRSKRRPSSWASHNKRSAETLLQVAAANGRRLCSARAADRHRHRSPRSPGASNRLRRPQAPSAALGCRIRPSDQATGGVVRGLSSWPDARPAAPNNPGPAESRGGRSRPRAAARLPLAIVRFRIDQCFDRHCSPDCRLG